MAIGHMTRTESLAVPVEVLGGTSFALLMALAAADQPGDAWTNLLGVPLDAGPLFTVERLVAALGEIDPVELRRQLLGRHAWSWCTVAGAETIEAAAEGDTSAAARLLDHPRYYGGRARAALAALLPLSAEETRRRLLDAVEAGAGSLLGAGAAEALDAAARAAAATVADQDPLDAIERITAGYRYVPEPEAERVVLIPHLERGARLLLAQHRGARLIVFRARHEPGADERLLTLGRALADPKRVEILGLLGRGVRGISALVRETGLARSTVHHHLAQLREAGLIVLEGNARSYTYLPRREAADEAAALLEDVVG